MPTNIPDFNIDLSVASDFLLSTRLCRKALESATPKGLGNIVRDLLKTIDMLSFSCHLPEFTDHGLSHLVSVVDRASEWTLVDGSYLVDGLNSVEASLLLLGLLIHDVGMLSQDPLDLEEDFIEKGMSSVASWVRKTHNARIPRLMERTLEAGGYIDFVKSDYFNLMCRIAMAHEEWSWQNEAKHYPKIREILSGIPKDSNMSIDPSRAFAIAAIIAVCDLLDEDSQRCDTETLISHRQGTSLNKSHWIRHLLTKNRVKIQKNKFTFEFRWLRYDKSPRGESFDQDPSGCLCEARYRQVINALKNQASSALLYNDDLIALKANLSDPEYIESRDKFPIPWNLPALKDFWGCAPERLLQSVFKFAINPNDEIRKKWEGLEGSAAFNDLELNRYYSFLGILGEEVEPRFDEEITFESIIKANL